MSTSPLSYFFNHLPDDYFEPVFIDDIRPKIKPKIIAKICGVRCVITFTEGHYTLRYPNSNNNPQRDYNVMATLTFIPPIAFQNDLHINRVSGAPLSNSLQSKVLSFYSPPIHASITNNIIILHSYKYHSILTLLSLTPYLYQDIITIIIHFQLQLIKN